MSVLCIGDDHDKDNDVFRTPLKAVHVLSAGEGYVASGHFRDPALDQKTLGKMGIKRRGIKVSYP